MAASKPKVKIKIKIKKSPQATAPMPPEAPPAPPGPPAPDGAPAGAPYKRGGKTKAKVSVRKRGGKC